MFHMESSSIPNDHSESEPGAVATGVTTQVLSMTRSHPPPHAGHPRGDPGSLPVPYRVLVACLSGNRCAVKPSFPLGHHALTKGLLSGCRRNFPGAGLPVVRRARF